MKIRRNSHYGYSPIACRSLKNSTILGKGERVERLSAPKGAFFILLEVVMKKVIALFLSIALLCACTIFFGCNKSAEEVEITIEQKYLKEDCSLYDYMVVLERKGKIDFKCESGAYGMFILEINGVSNGIGGNPCWMVYTDAKEWQDLSEWGDTVVKNGVEYRSASVGISSIMVSSGQKYMFKLVKF